ncbi:Crp/Fnr family transcriptional regulator [Inquilinus sp. OTU3971]|uniref:Crp/Fnr family transcriptional regulator n=1 Tax=Inquilinus sp. OTU3971 TaxID=3043855 RepID=UPI00313C28DE
MEVDYMPLLHRLRRLISLSDDEIGVLKYMHARRRIHFDSETAERWNVGKSPLLILNGWAYTYRHLRNGGRQLIDILIPGDIAGLRSSFLGAHHQEFRTIGQVETAEINSRLIPRLFEDWPRLALALLLIANQDSEFLAERLVSVGRRPALARVSHFLLELGARLEIVGLGTRESFRCPLTQADIADALGLSAIHVNRVLRHLREQRLLVFRNGEVEIQDPQRLYTLAQFELPLPTSASFEASAPLRLDLRRR